jgi:hypothetical protein
VATCFGLALVGEFAVDLLTGDLLAVGAGEGLRLTASCCAFNVKLVLITQSNKHHRAAFKHLFITFISLHMLGHNLKTAQSNLHT